MSIEAAIQAYDFPADGYRRIIVFRDEEVFRETMAANPNMTAIMGADGLTKRLFPGVLIAGVKRQAGTIRIDGTAPHTKEDWDTLAAVISGVLQEQAGSQPRQPETTERRQRPGEEPPPPEQLL